MTRNDGQDRIQFSTTFLFDSIHHVSVTFYTAVHTAVQQGSTQTTSIYQHTIETNTTGCTYYFRVFFVYIAIREQRNPLFRLCRTAVAENTEPDSSIGRGKNITLGSQQLHGLRYLEEWCCYGACARCVLFVLLDCLIGPGRGVI